MIIPEALEISVIYLLCVYWQLLLLIAEQHRLCKCRSETHSLTSSKASNQVTMLIELLDT